MAAEWRGAAALTKVGPVGGGGLGPPACGISGTATRLHDENPTSGSVESNESSR